MVYHFEFAPVLARYDLLVNGAILTIALSATAIFFGTAIGIVMASVRTAFQGWIRRIIDFYVEIVRNTPFLVQLYILYFGLPAIGLRVTAIEAALIGMIINLGAYSIEIIRAGIESIHKSQIEAGLSLGMSGFQIFRHVIIRPALANVYPALSSQFILMMLASSITSAISTPELSAQAAQIGADTFRSFEVYTVVTVIYLGLALLFKAVLAGIARLFLSRRRVRTASRMTAFTPGAQP